jgi:hypothetical protein
VADKAAPLAALVEALRDAIATTPSGAASLAWAEIAGERISAHAWVERIAGDTLEIAVDSPAWAHSLHLMAPELLGRLRERAHLAESVCRIRFRPARPADDDLPATAVETPAAAPARACDRADDGGSRLSQEVIAELSAAIARAGDAQLVEALRGLLRVFVGSDPAEAGGRLSGRGRMPGSSFVEG